MAADVEDGRVVVGVHVGELLRGGQLLLRDLVREELLALLVLEHLLADGVERRVRARRRGEVDIEVRGEDVIGVRGLGEVPALEECEYAR